MGKEDTGEKAGAGDLPRWDLSSLFPGPQSDEFQDALTEADRAARVFAEQYSGRVGKLTPDDFGTAIMAYEKVMENIVRIGAYAHLRAAVDNSEAAWAQSVAERVSRMAARTVFFTNEINKMREAELFARFRSPKVAAYVSWLGQVRSQRMHQLDEESERYLLEKSSVADKAWQRLFTQTMADMRFEYRGKNLTTPEILNIINASPSQEDRREAFDLFGRTLNKNGKLFTLITNTLADLKSMDDVRRHFNDVADSRHLANQIDPVTVETMAKSVRAAYGRTAHRYYGWKARKFGVQKLHPADRNAPLPGHSPASTSWVEARKIVLDAYYALSPEMGDIAKAFFDENRIDAAPRAGKRAGAFANSTVPSARPYVSLNFYGSPRNVQTLAHELGHGIHHVLAGKQGYLKSRTPLVLSETASVFGEMLVFRSLLDREDDLYVRRNMIAAKVEDMLNTVVRQTAFYTFEHRVHTERREKGELSQERISAIWKQTQKESLGPAIDHDTTGAQNMWMYVPHFIQSPFYVYAYAFGDCLANVLYDAYEKSENKQDFVDKYIDFLSAGGSKPLGEALASFGLDVTEAKFWNGGLSLVERYIDELFVLDQRIALLEKDKTPPNKKPNAGLTP